MKDYMHELSSYMNQHAVSIGYDLDLFVKKLD